MAKLMRSALMVAVVAFGMALLGAPPAEAQCTCSGQCQLDPVCYYCGFCAFCCSTCSYVSCHFCVDDQCLGPGADAGGENLEGTQLASLGIGEVASSKITPRCSVEALKPRAVQILTVERLPNRT